MILNRFCVLLLVGPIIGLAIGCSSVSKTEPYSSGSTIDVHLSDEELTLHQELMWTTADTTVRFIPTRFEILLTDVSTAAGPLPLIYCDLEEPDTCSIPAPTISGFRFGASEGAELPDSVRLRRMAWPETLGGGFHYLRFEGFVIDGVRRSPVQIHLGPAEGVDRSLPLIYNPATSSVHIEVATLFSNLRHDDPILAKGIMDQPDIQSSVLQNVVDAFTGSSR